MRRPLRRGALRGKKRGVFVRFSCNNGLGINSGYGNAENRGIFRRFGWNNPAGSHEREVYGDFMGWAVSSPPSFPFSLCVLRLLVVNWARTELTHGGWQGWGGSVSVVDPSRKATLMYVMSAQAQGLTGDVRMLRIMDAVQACMAAAGV